MVALPRISIGKKNKRSYFDLTHDVNTTADFGFCQPTLVREFYKDCKINLKTKEFVRLGAMPCPTFGRIEVKTHTAFVPVKETFLAYDYLQAQKSVTSAFRTYIPQCADYVTSNTILGSIVELICDTSSYFTSGTNFFDSSRFLGRFSVWTQWLGFCPQTHPLYSSHQPGDMVDIVNDDAIIGDAVLSFRACSALFNLVCGVKDSLDFNTSPFYGKLRDVFKRTSLGLISTQSGNVNTSCNYLWFLNFGTYNPNRPMQPWDINNSPYSGEGYGNRFMASYSQLFALSQYSDDFLQSMSFDKPDFRLGSWQVNAYSSPDSQNTFALTLYVNMHLSRAGRRLYKVLTGCRINFGTKNKKIDMMRLLSYYKAWFDKYNPGRNLQWLDTNAFGLIHSYYDYGSVLDNVINRVGADYNRIPNDLYARYLAFWFNFLVDLPQCCYVLKPDNMTCATPSPLLEVSNNDDSINSIKLPFQDGTSSEYAQPSVGDHNLYGYTSSVSAAGGLGLQLLNRIYHLVNKNSVIGSKIDEYLKSHNISLGLPQSNVLGDMDFMCGIDDVFSTAGTTETNLGEYAGKGLGSGSSDVMNFECESFGYLIQMLSVVPLGGYVQGMRDCPIERYDFYQSEFDSLGMEPMSKSNFLNRRFNIENFYDDDVVFGFRPRYFGLKIENNLANGGFSLYSQQTQFLPYCLDRIFSLDDFDNINQEDYVADEELRYIGRYERFGNYDRIFYDTKGLTDNFIIHMIQELKMYAPWKPISESYDTYDKDVDDTSIDVEKA
ncbi:major capsid protein [Microvirus sp.]|nr:major capsid protein [Microvirus sp.]